MSQEEILSGLKQLLATQKQIKFKALLQRQRDRQLSRGRNGRAEHAHDDEHSTHDEAL